MTHTNESPEYPGRFNHQLRTGVANIGIRGTEYVVKLCEQDDCSSAVSRNDPRAKLHAVVLAGSISLTSEDGLQVLLAQGEYATATAELLVLENEKALPVGLLDTQEAQKLSLVRQQPEQEEEAVPVGLLDTQEAQKLSLVRQQPEQEEEASNSWLWIVGILLLFVGL